MHPLPILSVLTAVAFSGLATAVTTPVGNPKGNAIIKPSLGEIVPCGKPYDITWNPDTPGTVSLLLLRGPSENVVPIGPPIVEGYQNSGKYKWTPSCDLEPDTLRYGIQLIVDKTGQYQYSVQFGISNPGFKGTTAKSITGTATATATSTGRGTGGYPTSTKLTYVPSTTIAANSTTKYTTSTSTSTKESTTTEAEETTKSYAKTTLITTTIDATTTKAAGSKTTATIPPSSTGGSAGLFVNAAMAALSIAAAGFVLL